MYLKTKDRAKDQGLKKRASLTRETARCPLGLPAGDTEKSIFPPVCRSVKEVRRQSARVCPQRRSGRSLPFSARRAVAAAKLPS